MNINRRVIKYSEDENNSGITDKLATRKKRKRSVEVESSSDENNDINNLDSADRNKEKYL